MIPVMFYLTRWRNVQIEFVEINRDMLTEDSEEVQSAIQEFHRQGREVKRVYISKKSAIVKPEIVAIEPELPRPKPILFAASFIMSLKTVLDHLFHIRNPDLEDLGQNLLGRLQLQNLEISPRSAMLYSSLLWPHQQL